MVPDHTTQNFSARGHTMVTTFTGKGEEKEEIYLIGGLGKNTYVEGYRDIRKLMKDPARKIAFETIPTKLKYGRAYHIALPISYELAKESCKGHYSFDTKKSFQSESKSKPYNTK